MWSRNSAGTPVILNNYLMNIFSNIAPLPTRRILLLVGLWGASCFALGPGARSPGDSPPNVLLILTDNQSYFELSTHGHAQLQTPHIDRLAAQSVNFQNFHAPPFCSPSRAEMLTGRYALRSGVHDTVGGRSILHRNEATLADYLGGSGYHTAIFGKWHLGLSHPYHPSERGFDEVFIHGGGGIGQMEDYFGNDHYEATWDHNGTMVKRSGYSTNVLFAEATQFMDSVKNQPFFCFISTPATHTPWQSEPRARKRIEARGVEAEENDLKLYSMIENIDENVGALMAWLEEKNLAENTIVVFATDQGIQDRGAPSPRSAEKRESHNSAFDPKHQVFCMVRYPPLTKAQSQPALAGMVDLAPTILDLCGLPPMRSMDGRSLLPLLVGASEWEDDRRLIVHCPRQRYREKWANAVVKTQRWRLVGGDQLYDIAADPSQLNDVAAAHPEVVVELSAEYDQFWQTLPPERETLSRHLLGSRDAPDVRLVCMDWYQGASPWHQLHLQRNRLNGVWPVDIVREGRYQFELRWFPREAPTAIGAHRASIRVGANFQSMVIALEDQKAVFQLNLALGEFDLETAFLNVDPDSEYASWGAYFVYVTYLGP